jgi:hypothetical protein
MFIIEAASSWLTRTDLPRAVDIDVYRSAWLHKFAENHKIWRAQRDKASAVLPQRSSSRPTQGQQPPYSKKVAFALPDQGVPQHGIAAKPVRRRPSEHHDSHSSEVASYLLPPSGQGQDVLQPGTVAKPVRRRPSEHDHSHGSEAANYLLPPSIKSKAFSSTAWQLSPSDGLPVCYVTKRPSRFHRYQTVLASHLPQTMITCRTLISNPEGLSEEARQVSSRAYVSRTASVTRVDHVRIVSTSVLATFVATAPKT